MPVLNLPLYTCVQCFSQMELCKKDLDYVARAEQDAVKDVKKTPNMKLPIHFYSTFEKVSHNFICLPGFCCEGGESYMLGGELSRNFSCLDCRCGSGKLTSRGGRMGCHLLCFLSPTTTPHSTHPSGEGAAWSQQASEGR